MPEEIRKRKTAFLWSFENMMDIENHPHHADFNAWQYIYRYYAILEVHGLSRYDGDGV